MAHFAEALSFMRRRKPRGTGINYWCVEPTGSYGNDCATGAQLATEYLEFIGKHPTVGHATLLNCIVSDIHKNAGTKGFSGIEVGFFRQINQFAMVAAQLWTGNLPKGGAA